MDDQVSENDTFGTGSVGFRYSMNSDNQKFMGGEVPENEPDIRYSINSDSQDNQSYGFQSDVPDETKDAENEGKVYYEDADEEEGDEESPEKRDEEAPPLTTSRREESVASRTKKSRMGVPKGKSVKAPVRPSTALLDAEEERLKMLVDCCEYTRKLDTHEVNDTRKEMSSAWFSQIELSTDDQKKLCFSESLLMVEETGTVVGKTYCSIQRAKWCETPCLCIHAGSFAKFSTGLESGTSITSFVNPDMKTLQEFVYEWATMQSDTIERKTFIITEGEAMTCKISVTRNGKPIDTKSVNVRIKERDNLVTEGGNLLLQRWMIHENRTIGTMNLQCMSYTGKVAKSKYGELGSSWENVRGSQVKTWGIRRTVTINEDEERIWDSLYNKHSRLILRCQPESPVAMIPLWFESIIEFDKNGTFIGVCSPYAWACDMELYSKYSIKKDDLTHDHRRYILDHPEVRALLSDYLQTVLFRKPLDVVEFTKQYFEAFVPPAGKGAKGKVRTRSSGFGSFYQYGSSGSRSMVTESGEWLGEDGYYGEDWMDFYSDDPKVNYDGLEKVDSASEAYTSATKESDYGSDEEEEEEEEEEPQEDDFYFLGNE